MHNFKQPFFLDTDARSNFAVGLVFSQRIKRKEHSIVNTNKLKPRARDSNASPEKNCTTFIENIHVKSLVLCREVTTPIDIIIKCKADVTLNLFELS